MNKQTLLLLLVVFSLAVFGASCKKDDKETITYELTFKANKATNGTTTFDEIKYKDANGVVQTVTNPSGNFSTTFQIKSGTAIEFSVMGTVTSSSFPDAIFSYSVEEVTNGTSRAVICNESKSSISGTGGGIYTINTVFSRTFVNGSCQ